jgi:1,4-dihydroxy-2-naphthoyl-CoA synthase
MSTMAASSREAATVDFDREANGTVSLVLAGCELEVEVIVESSFAEALSLEGQSQAIAWGTEDAAEGITAFLERRDPEWKGR